MSEMIIKINNIQDVGTIIEIALRNGYKATSKPVYELYWKTKIDHYEVSLEEMLKD